MHCTSFVDLVSSRKKSREWSDLPKIFQSLKHIGHVKLLSRCENGNIRGQSSSRRRGGRTREVFRWLGTWWWWGWIIIPLLKRRRGAHIIAIMYIQIDRRFSGRIVRIKMKKIFERNGHIYIHTYISYVKCLEEKKNVLTEKTSFFFLNFFLSLDISLTSFLNWIDLSLYLLVYTMICNVYIYTYVVCMFVVVVCVFEVSKLFLIFKNVREQFHVKQGKNRILSNCNRILSNVSYCILSKYEGHSLTQKKKPFSQSRERSTLYIDQNLCF